MLIAFVAGAVILGTGILIGVAMTHASFDKILKDKD